MVTYNVGAREAIVAELLRRLAQRDHFRVRSGIAIGDGAVSRARHDLIIHHHHRADWYFAAFRCGARFVQRGLHEACVFVGSSNIAYRSHSFFAGYHGSPASLHRRHVVFPHTAVRHSSRYPARVY